MPGHKADGDFCAAFPAALSDITELPFSDDLQSPVGAIKSAQEEIARIVGADRAYITTDGSSSGVMALLFAASRFGKKIIVFRNSHKSVFNACRLTGVEPVVAEGREREGVILPPAPEEIERLYTAGVAGIMATSPDYYGNVAPLEEYKKIAERHGGFLFADGAHGAHLAFEEGRRGYAGLFADAWVDGAHKTLPALTQGASVLCSEKFARPVEEGLSLFRTTSPSYPIMASVEFGYRYLQSEPSRVACAKRGAARLKSLFGEGTFYPADDWTKLLLDCKRLGADPAAVERKLAERGIYIEMNDGRYLLFYLSPMVTERAFGKLGAALGEILSLPEIQNTYRGLPRVAAAGKRRCGYLKAVGAEAEYVPLRSAAGRICAENAGVTPPCFPVVAAGEEIGREAVQILGGGRNTFGIVGGKIKVVKE